MNPHKKSRRMKCQNAFKTRPTHKEWVMCFSKYDVLVQIKEGVDPTSLAISLKSHMSYGVRSSAKMNNKGSEGNC